MASDTLPALSDPNFPQDFEDAIEFEIRRVREIVERHMPLPAETEQEAEVSRG